MTAVFIFILKQTNIKKQGPPFDDPETSFDNLVNEMRQRYKQILIRQYYLIIRTTPYVKFSFHLSFIHGMPWDVYHLTRATITSLFHSCFESLLCSHFHSLTVSYPVSEEKTLYLSLQSSKESIFTYRKRLAYSGQVESPIQ